MAPIGKFLRRCARPLTLGLAVSLAGVALSSGVARTPTVSAFGTVSVAGQRTEHERITRIALGCAPGVRSNGECFEPKSLDQLAGQDGSFGAVGAPDSDDQVLDPSAHCDDGDFLNQPGYPRSRAEATATIQACINHLRDEFRNARDAAAELLDDDGSISMFHALTEPDCTFTGGVPLRAKCNVLQGFGRTLHGVQDFYSHSNWADEADPGQPVSIANPPGLNLPAPSPVLNMRASGPASLPANLVTGFTDFGSLAVPGPDCPGESGRITHACLNKDEADIQPGPGVEVNGVPVPGLGSVTDPLSPRSRIGQNALKAVGGAIIESRRQWADLRVALVEKYGREKATLMIGVLTRDSDLSLTDFLPDLPPLPDVPNAPNVPTVPNVPGAPGIPGIPGLPRP